MRMREGKIPDTGAFGRGESITVSLRELDLEKVATREVQYMLGKTAQLSILLYRARSLRALTTQTSAQHRLRLGKSIPRVNKDLEEKAKPNQHLVAFAS